MKYHSDMKKHTGATLIEVLVAILILSIGLLALAAMMGYATLLPKFSANRSVATVIGTDMIERMRANATTESPSFTITSYNTATFTASTTFVTSSSLPAGSTCQFPNCTQASIAREDIARIQLQLNQQLTPAGITINATNAATNEGNLWVIWQEATTFGSYATASSDNCPAAVIALALNPAPRCVYLPFKL
jgi:type IV pilus assembly protein PilV